MLTDRRRMEQVGQLKRPGPQPRGLALAASRRRARSALAVGLLVLSAAACSSSSETPQVAGRQPLDYASASNWLCHPDLPGDECLTADLTATEVLPDGTSQIVNHVVASEPKYDCFYVYPTVALDKDLPDGPVDASVLSDHRPMLDALLSQAARFTGQCRVFSPLYRQVTIGTYDHATTIDSYLEEAYVDVAAAFDAFLGSIGDRPFVVMSHSQGSHLSRRLLQRQIDPNPALVARLITGLIIGGDTLADSYQNIPSCTSDDQVGCVIAYRTFAVGYGPTLGKPLPAGQVCTNPAALAGGEGRLMGSYFPRTTYQAVLGTWHTWPDSITTPFVLMRNFYSSECVAQGGANYLEIRASPSVSDKRQDPIDFGILPFSPEKSALHVLDYDFPLEDLMRVVAAKATAKGL
jgi:pimeloyl-ACP methyl ester carboxylesterase